MLLALVVLFYAPCAFAVGCNQSGASQVQASGNRAIAQLKACEKTGQALKSGRSSHAGTCNACLSALKKARSFRKTFKSFANSCATRVGANSIRKLREVTWLLEYSMAPLAKTMKDYCS